MTVAWPEPPDWLEDAFPRRIWEMTNELTLERVALTGHSPTEVRDWLLRIMKEMHCSSTELARLAGLAASTLNRFLRQPADDPANLTARSIEAIKQVVSSALGRTAEVNKSLPQPFDPYTFGQDPNKDRSHAVGGPVCFWPERAVPTRKMFLRGWVENGKFLPREKWRDAPEYPVVWPLFARHINSSYLVMHLRGECGLPLYPAMSILIGRFILGSLTVPPIGAKLFVFRRSSRDEIECGLWRLALDPAGNRWLMPLNEARASDAIYLGREFHPDPLSIYISHIVSGHSEEQADGW